MQPLAVDLRSLIKLQEGFAKAATTGADRRAVSAALRKALQPMLEAARRKAPRRTGATIRDQRIKMVAGEGDELSRGLVGTSGGKSKVGWRTHFITRGVKNGGRSKRIFIVPRDFLASAEKETMDEVIKRFGDLIEPELLKQLKSL